MPAPEDWFRSVIAEGLQRLAVMRLPSHPQETELELTCAIWIDSLWFRRAWHEEPDAGRLRRAFLALAGAVRRWPSPADLLDHLPAKPQPPALPAPARGRGGAAHLSVMKDLIARAYKPMPGTTPRSQ